MRLKGLRILGFLTIFGLWTMGGPAISQPRSIIPDRVRVRMVVDGDTIGLSIGEKVRYAGVDAPEIDFQGGKDEFMARQAKACNVELVKGAYVRLQFDRTRRDRYGRLLSFVFLEDGKMVNALLLQKGLARVMTQLPNRRYREFLIRCQRMAMKQRRGIWSRGPRNHAEFYPGNRNSFRFHRPGCYFGGKIRPRHRVRFATPSDAYWEGYSPCRHCRP